ncbi:unnamed protein product, partial [marine sediment metagenome]
PPNSSDNFCQYALSGHELVTIFVTLHLPAGAGQRKNRARILF